MATAISFTISLLLMVAYWPEFSGLATTPRWDVGALIAVALLFAPSVRMTRAHWAGVALVAWLIVSLAWSDGQSYGLDAAWKLIAVGVAFAFGATLVDPVPCIAGAALGLAISSAIVLAQWFGWHGIESAASPAGLFWNGNRLAEATVLVLAAALARRLWWAIPGLVPALVIPYDRAAWLAAAIVAAVWMWRRMATFERFVSAMICAWIVVGIAIVGTFWRTEQFGMNAIAERVELWRFTLANLTWLGHGLGSFSADGPLFAWHGVLVSRATHPHNEFLWLAYDGGLPAIGLLGVLAVFGWRAVRGNGLGLVILAFALIACVAMPFHDPASVLFSAVVAGHVIGAGRDVRDPAHDGGILLREGDGSGDGDRAGAIGLAAVARALSV